MQQNIDNLTKLGFWKSGINWDLTMIWSHNLPQSPHQLINKCLGKGNSPLNSSKFYHSDVGSGPRIARKVTHKHFQIILTTHDFWKLFHGEKCGIMKCPNTQTLPIPVLTRIHWLLHNIFITSNTAPCSLLTGAVKWVCYANDAY